MDRWRKCMKSRQIIELGNWKAWHELGSAVGRGRAELAQILNVCSRVNETAWWKWTGQQRNHGSHPAVKWSWRGLGAFCSQIHEMPWASSLGEHQHGSLGDGIKQKPKRSWWNLQQTPQFWFSSGCARHPRTRRSVFGGVCASRCTQRWFAQVLGLQMATETIRKTMNRAKLGTLSPQIPCYL